MSDVAAAAPEPSYSAPPTLEDIAAGYEAELNAEDGREPEPQQAEPTPDAKQSPAGLLAEEQDQEPDQDQDEPELQASSDAEPDSEADPDDSLSDPDEDNASSEASFLPGMSEEERQTFAKLPAELQSWVSTREASRQADYTRKTQAVAERTKELTQSVAATLEKINQYDQILAEFTEQDIEPPPEYLKREDPLLYEELRDEYNQKQYNKNLAEKQRTQIAQERDAHAAYMHQQWVAEQSNLLVQAEPMFADPERGPKLRQELQDYALKQGFDQGALANLSAKEAQILLKAKRYDDAMARRSTDKAAAPKAKPPKVATPGVSRVGRPTRAAAAVRDFDSNPNAGRDDLARLFEAELAAEQR